MMVSAESKEGKLIIKCRESDSAIRIYEFDSGQDIISDHNIVILKKAAIQKLVVGENIKVGEPKAFFIGSSIVISRSAQYGTRIEYAIGEASKNSLKTDIAKTYPFITADNRAYQRAVLQVLGLAGRFYGEDEIQRDSSGSDDPFDYPVISSDMATTSVGSTEAIHSVSSNLINSQQTTSVRNSTVSNTIPANRYIIKPEHTTKYHWLTQQAADEVASIDPDTYVINQGRNKNKGWTASQMLLNDLASTEWYAEKSIGTNEKFNEAIRACRAAIIKALCS